MAAIRNLSLTLVTLCALGTCGSLDAQYFIRGDANGDNQHSVADDLKALQVLFSGESIPCLEAIDVNDDGRLDIADPISHLTYLFLGGAAPAEPFLECGVDPTPDDIGCDKDLDSCALGSPIDGLTVTELQSFHRGKALMSKQFTPSEGLGPMYNTTSCGGCHDKPVVGGSSPIYRNFILVQIGEPGSGQFAPPGQPSPVMPSYNGFDGARPIIPADPYDGGILGDLPVRQSSRNAPPFFGVGLFEFVSDGTITAGADPNDSDDDGISGRYNQDIEDNIGRFGYKLQANFIEAFIRGAAFNQMGITTDPVDGADAVVDMMLMQVASAFDDPTEDDDGVPDPEISVDDFGDIINFNRFLRPPRRLALTTDGQDGEILFDDIGCTDCHLPILASSKGDLEAYTDLLLHHMGDERADGIHMGSPQASTIDGDTTENEFRTQPLWGVRHHGPFLHDGAADTLHDAIVMHGGEAEDSRVEYEELTDDERAQILEFLNSL